MKSVKLLMFFVAGLLVLVSLPALPTFWSTTLKPSEHFFGISPLKKPVTSIVIVHGIGDHCIGYADELISNLVGDLTGNKVRSLEEVIAEYEAQLRNSESDDLINPPRNGNCTRAPFASAELNEMSNTGDDVESVVLSEDSLCESINRTTGITGQAVSETCHKLYVDRWETKYPGENPEYITGFIRGFSTNVTAKSRLNVYELTWSPATRWIKQSLRDLERFNDSNSAHILNRALKAEVVNASIADAVAYLSDTGVLINFDVLQSFCLAVANSQALESDYAFACDQSHLRGVDKTFSRNNDVVLITHSLGTRIVFDTIGMLALGSTQADAEAAEAEQGKAEKLDLVSVIAERFDRIGAVVPDEYFRPQEGQVGFSEAMQNAVPEFAKSVRSIFTFTNQVPLLAADLTSPFREQPDVGIGFQQFLQLRETESDEDRRLQMVSFHDPDDLLSYNLRCWYYQSVLKELDDTKKLINDEAEARAGQNNTKASMERRRLRDALFVNSCSVDGLGLSERQLHDEIWSVESNLLKLVDAGVRLRGFRLEGLAANPMDVHSNYFSDASIHHWLINGP